MNKPTLTDLPSLDDAANTSRRRFLKSLIYSSAIAISSPKLAQAAFSGFAFKRLSFEHHHTGSNIDITYFEQGRYIESALKEINYFMRDYHNNLVHAVDPRLLDQLHDLKLFLGVKKPFHVVSGYRSPETNASLRRQSSGVAKHSLHMEGKAIDIRIEGVAVKTIRDAALTLQRGGVGYYPNENFVHLDTGDIRTWRR